MNPLEIGRNITINDAEFKNLSQLIYDKFGIHLPEAKRALLLTRLQKIINEKKFDSYSQYYDFLTHDSSGEALSSLVNRISTNFTYFYREPEHFIFFHKEILPHLESYYNEKKKIRVWCAGCSTGEEAYQLAIIMMQYFGEKYRTWDAGVLATDISQRALDKAIAGIYEKEAISKLPPMFRNSFFNPVQKGIVKIDNRVQKEVTFRRFNLMNKVFPFKDQFDVIFCRNVMIYFDNQTRTALINRFINQLKIGGHFFIGHSETISRENAERLKYVKPSLYQRIN